MEHSIILPTHVKRYEDFDDLACYFFNCEKNKLAEVTVYGDELNPNAESPEISYDEFKKGVAEQKVWGFIDETSFHLWLDDSIGLIDLTHFVTSELSMLNINVVRNDEGDDYLAEIIALICTQSIQLTQNILTMKSGD